MTITGGSALPKDDIERMVKEAEEHAEEDKKRREDMETRNVAEQTAYSIEKLLKENEDKVSEDTRKSVQTAIDEVKSSLEGDDTDSVKKALDHLNEVGMKIGEEVYKAAEAQAAEEELPSQEDVNAEEEVIDAEIVDDEDTK